MDDEFKNEFKDERKRPVFIHSSLDDIPLSMEAFRVYCHLARRANDCHQAWPSYRSIGEKCFRGSYPESKSDSLRRKAMSAVQELIAWNLIRVEHRDATDGSQTSNLYCLTDDSKWAKFLDEPSINARKSCAYRPRASKGGDGGSPPGDGSSPGGVVMGVHHPSDGGSPGGDGGSPRSISIEVNPIEGSPFSPLTPQGEPEGEREEELPTPEWFPSPVEPGAGGTIQSPPTVSDQPNSLTQPKDPHEDPLSGAASLDSYETNKANFCEIAKNPDSIGGPDPLVSAECLSNACGSQDVAGSMALGSHLCGGTRNDLGSNGLDGNTGEIADEKLDSANQPTDRDYRVNQNSTSEERAGGVSHRSATGVTHRDADRGSDIAAGVINKTSQYMTQKIEEKISPLPKEMFGQPKRRVDFWKGKESSCASDPWMISDSNPDPIFKQWVYEKQKSAQKNRDERYGNFTPSLANAASEIRNDYMRAADLWQEFLAEMAHRIEVFNSRVESGSVTNEIEWKEMKAIAPYSSAILTDKSPLTFKGTEDKAIVPVLPLDTSKTPSDTPILLLTAPEDENAQAYAVFHAAALPEGTPPPENFKAKLQELLKNRSMTRYVLTR